MIKIVMKKIIIAVLFIVCASGLLIDFKPSPAGGQVINPDTAPCYNSLTQRCYSQVGTVIKCEDGKTYFQEGTLAGECVDVQMVNPTSLTPVPPSGIHVCIKTVYWTDCRHGADAGDQRSGGCPLGIGC